MGIVYFNVFVLLLLFGLQGTICDEADLYHNIFGTYEPKVRPRHNPAEAVEVELEFELNSINGIDEINQVLDTSGFVVAKWTDDYLKWNPDSYGGIEHVVVPASSVWLPDFGIVNSAEAFYKSTYFDNYRVDIQYTGRMIWAFGGNFKTGCELDLTHYPFDMQECHIEIENWAYTKKAVTLVRESEVVHTSNYQDSAEWHLLNTSAEESDIYVDTHPGAPISKITFALSIQRKFSYYGLNIITPTVFVTSCSLAMFWLPVDSGEKIGLGITILLAFSVLQLVVADHTPRTSDFTPILSVYICTVMGLSTLSVLMTIFSIYVFFKSKTRLSPCLRKVLKVCAKAMCMSDRLPDSDSIPDEEVGDIKKSQVSPLEDITDIDNEEKKPIKLATKPETGALLGTEAEIRAITQYMESYSKKLEEQDHDSIIEDEWKALSNVMDRILFWVTLVAVVIATIIVMAPGAISYDKNISASVES